MATLAILNLPLGYFRSEHIRFTYGWYFYLSLSLPVIVYMRVKTGYDWRLVSLPLSGAMAGQILGGLSQHLRRGSGRG